MMLAQLHAESNKKALSNIIVSVFLILIATSAILVFWISVRKVISKSPETSCIDLISSFSVKKACYLNEKEVLVQIRRDFDSVNVESLRFSFSNGESNIWELSGKKCSDARTEENYGDYCNIIKPGQEIKYIFDFSNIAKKKNVKIAARTSAGLCSVSGHKIEGNC